MTQPTGRVRMSSKPRGSSRVGSGGVRNLTVRVVLGQDVFECHGSGRGHPVTRFELREVIRPVKSVDIMKYSTRLIVARKRPVELL